MWIWIIKTGELVRDGKVIGIGYSGGNKGRNPEGKNNPAMQHVHDIGPIPCGKIMGARVFFSMDLVSFTPKPHPVLLSDQ